MELTPDAQMLDRWTAVRQALRMLQGLHANGMAYDQAIELMDDLAVKTLLGNGCSAGELLEGELSRIRREFRA